jgi:hypothetical protein
MIRVLFSIETALYTGRIPGAACTEQTAEQTPLEWF